MATAPVSGNRPQEVKKHNWQEVKAPEQFKWTRVGETMIGVLLSIEPITVKQKPGVEYMFQLENGNRITMLETNDLKKKILATMLGYWLNIRYEKDERYEGQNPDQSAMKIFKVMIGEKEPGF